MPHRLTLTFDNGPDPEATPRILDELARRGLRATFFVVGRALQAAGARDLVERARQEGHWVGNHTLTHGAPLGTRKDPASAIHEVAAMQTLLGALAHPPKLFRPNAGGGRLGPHMLSSNVIDYLCAERYTVVTWNSVPRDWEAPSDAWVQRALDDIARQEETLLVLHDMPGSGAAAHLPRFLDRLERDGVEVVQDFPDACVPIKAGQRSPVLDALMAL